MKLAIASGKGGTGKTTLSVALALSIDSPVRLLDCDVEEPNCHIFLHNGTETHSEPVTVPIPVVDESKCTSCGKCAKICQFNAIISLKTIALVFPELCHSCGGCTLVCPSGAIKEEQQQIGALEFSTHDNISFVMGKLNVGHAMSPPVIRSVKEHTLQDGLTILDCPPGTSCPVITAIKDVDYVLLVTEPTPFGLHDLTLAVETMRELGVPFGVAVNRSDAGDREVFNYCERENIKIQIEVPESRLVAEAYSKGDSIISAIPEMKIHLQSFIKELQQKYDGGSK